MTSKHNNIDALMSSRFPMALEKRIPAWANQGMAEFAHPRMPILPF
jgi:hypothetical protein